MQYTAGEVLQYVKENDVKFVKLTFCDLFGRQKNLSLVSSRLKAAFSEGVPFAGAGVPGLLNATEDLLLFPDPETLTALPWRPQAGRVVSLFCHIRYADGRPFEADGLHLLDQAVARLRDFSLQLSVGTDCEFYIMKRDEAGEPTTIPYDRATYCDAAPVDRCENVRRDIVLSLENMGFQPISSHHEKGPGQNEIDFSQADPLTAAKNLLLFRSAVKNVCNRDGLYATFMPKPFYEEAGSGLHVNLMLKRPGAAVLDRSFGLKNGEAEMFLEGVLSRVRDIMPFACATTNSYKRLGTCEAPQFVTWSAGNYGQLVKYFTGADGHGFKLRFADCLSNPFILTALLIHAGLDGIEEKRALRPAVDGGTVDRATEKLSLPTSLDDAVAYAEKRDWLKKYLAVAVLEQYFAEKRNEAREAKESPDEAAFELRRYMDI